jgi:hypothetical protein
MHQRFTHGGIECVDGVLKCILSTPTVAQTDSVMRTIVNTRYLPNRGIASDVEGMVSMRTDRKNISDTKMDMVSVTWEYFCFALDHSVSQIFRLHEF